MRMQSKRLQPKALAQFRSDPAMTFQTERAHVRQIAFTAALTHGNDVIGIPKRFSAANLPAFAGIQARRTSEALDAIPFSNAINPADSADAAIPFEHSFTQMPGIAAQPPFLHAEIRAERNASGRNFQVAPTAKAAAVWAFRQSFAIGTAAGHGSLFAHRLRYIIHDVRPASDPSARRGLRGLCKRAQPPREHR